MKKTFLIITIVCIMHFFATGQSLSPAAMPAAGGYFTGGGNSLSWTLGETFHTTLQNGGLMLTQGEQQPEIKLRIINLKMFIEGYYTGAGMMDNYGSGGCLYVTSISANFSDVDTITVSAMDEFTKTLVGSAKGILQTDGSLTVNFDEPVSTGTSYYLKINHRNAIESWSANPVLFTSNILYDFTTSQSQVSGNNMVDVGTALMEAPLWAFYSGDINDANYLGLGLGYQDGVIDGNDYGDMETAVFSIYGGYTVEDLTGDGVVSGDDYGLMETNVFYIVSSVVP